MPPSLERTATDAHRSTQIIDAEHGRPQAGATRIKSAAGRASQNVSRITAGKAVRPPCARPRACDAATPLIRCTSCHVSPLRIRCSSIAAWSLRVSNRRIRVDLTSGNAAAARSAGGQSFTKLSGVRASHRNICSTSVRLGERLRLQPCDGRCRDRVPASPRTDGVDRPGRGGPRQAARLPLLIECVVERAQMEFARSHSVPLEKLDGALVLLGRAPGRERAQILPATGLRVLLARIQPVLPGGKLPDHWIHENSSQTAPPSAIGHRPGGWGMVPAPTMAALPAYSLFSRA